MLKLSGWKFGSDSTGGRLCSTIFLILLYCWIDTWSSCQYLERTWFARRIRELYPLSRAQECYIYYGCCGFEGWSLWHAHALSYRGDNLGVEFFIFSVCVSASVICCSFMVQFTVLVVLVLKSCNYPCGMPSACGLMALFCHDEFWLLSCFKHVWKEKLSWIFESWELLPIVIASSTNGYSLSSLS